MRDVGDELKKWLESKIKFIRIRQSTFYAHTEFGFFWKIRYAFCWTALRLTAIFSLLTNIISWCWNSFSEWKKNYEKRHTRQNDLHQQFYIDLILFFLGSFFSRVFRFSFAISLVRPFHSYHSFQWSWNAHKMQLQLVVRIHYLCLFALLECIFAYFTIAYVSLRMDKISDCSIRMTFSRYYSKYVKTQAVCCIVAHSTVAH